MTWRYIVLTRRISVHTLSKRLVISYDPEKNSRNIQQRGLPFELVAEFDFDSAKIWQDSRQSYPESRYVAIGYLGDRLHVLVFSETPSGIRVISFRKANASEGERHGFSLARS